MKRSMPPVVFTNGSHIKNDESVSAAQLLLNPVHLNSGHHEAVPNHILK